MDQNILQEDFIESVINVNIPLTNTNNDREKLNKCNQCEYASSVKSSLRRHLKIHSGEKSNKCNQCEFASAQAGTLKNHLKTHSGEKSNKCYQCDFASFQAGHLRKHMKMRSGEKSQTNATNVTLHLLGQAI